MSFVETFPLFDGHTHFSHMFLDQVMESYRQCGVIGGINIGGFHHLDYGQYLRAMNKAKLDNWTSFYWPSWRPLGYMGSRYVRKVVADMRRFAKLGCRGLKVWKDIGMHIFDANNKPVTMDDKRLEPIWQTAGELGWWISVHQSDPTRCWPWRTGITREEIWQRRDTVIAAHPGIRFILCHNCNDIESVAKFGETLDRFPNVWSDIGRDFLLHDTLADTQAFLEKYADRLFFGPDQGMPDERPPDFKWNREEYNIPWRKLLVSYGMSDTAFRKFTFENGQKLFMT